MNTAIKYFTGVLLLLLLFACPETPDTNPFDPECPKEKWTPANFKAVQSENKLDLTWEQDNMHISGFKIDRKVGTMDWTEVTSTGKTTTSWSDSDLKGGEVHQYRLYAYAGDNISNTVTAQATPVFTASLTTAAQNDLTCNSAILGGNISNTGGATITERGIVYSKSASPTTSDTKVAIGSGHGSFNQSVTVLEETTTYYVRAFSINSAGTSYGNQISFTTPACALPASVTTNSPTNISCTSATLGGNVTDDGGTTVTERGIVYATTVSPTISNTKVAIGSGTGTFSKTITGLAVNTVYWVRAYAVNSAGTSYTEGPGEEFKTSDIAILTTSTPTNVTPSSATLGGTITSDGGATVTERGIVYSTNNNPTTSDTKVVMGSGTGAFSQSVLGLTSDTRYYVRSFAINCAGISYGPEIPFKAEKLTGTFTDARDGNTYKWVKIGDQIWMAGNLAYLPSVSPPSEGSNTLPYYYVYGYNGTDVNAAKGTDNYKTYGVLYNWPAANTACPKGWHLPTDYEWKQLEMELGMTKEQADAFGERGTDQGTQLKNINGWNNNGNGTNTIGFSALAGGCTSIEKGGFYFIGELGYWWSSVEYDSYYAWYRRLYNDNTHVDRNADHKWYGFSIRCVRDN